MGQVGGQGQGEKHDTLQPSTKLPFPTPRKSARAVLHRIPISQEPELVHKRLQLKHSHKGHISRFAATPEGQTLTLIVLILLHILLIPPPLHLGQKSDETHIRNEQ